MGQYTTIHPPGICACHGAPLGMAGTKRICRIKQRIRTRMYQATAHGQAAKALANGRRVRMGGRHVCSVETPGEAAVLNAHILARRSAFTQTQRSRQLGALTRQ